MRQVGAYLLESLRGKGGMGSVYLGRHVHNGQQVAVKLLELSASQRQQLRFQREGRTLARLRHPGLVRVLGAGSSDSGLWLAMERLDGESLEERLRRAGPLSPAEARDLGLALTDALGAAHGEGVLHRDLKPDNVLLTERGPVVIDFGLAKDLEVKESIRLSQTGRLAGTPGYWAPEQARGEVRDAGPTTDVYGLGATLYAALSGGPPFKAPTLMEAVVATQTCPPPPLRGCPPRLERLLSRCLAKEPAQRPPSMESLATELRRLDLEASGGLLAKLGALCVLVLVAGLGFLAGAPPAVRSQLAEATPSAETTPPASPPPSQPPAAPEPLSSPPGAAPDSVAPEPTTDRGEWLSAELGRLAAPVRADRRDALLRLGPLLLAHGEAVFERAGARSAHAELVRLDARAQRLAEYLLADGPDAEVSLALARLRHGRAHVEAWVPNRPLAATLLRRSLSDYMAAAHGLRREARAACLVEWTEALYLLSAELRETIDRDSEFAPLARAVETWAEASGLPQALAAHAQLLSLRSTSNQDEAAGREATRLFQQALSRLDPSKRALRDRWSFRLGDHLMAKPQRDPQRARLFFERVARESSLPCARLLALGKLVMCADDQKRALRFAQEAEDYLFQNRAGLTGWGQGLVAALIHIDALERASLVAERLSTSATATPYLRATWLTQLASAYLRRRGDLETATKLATRAAEAFPSLHTRLIQAEMAVMKLAPERARELFRAPFQKGTSSGRLEFERAALDLALRAFETLMSKKSPRRALALTTKAQRKGSRLADQVFVQFALTIHRPERYPHWAANTSDLRDADYRQLASQALSTAARLVKGRRGVYRQQARTWQAQLAVGLWPLCTQSQLAGAYEILASFQAKIPSQQRVIFLDDMVRLCALLGRHGGPRGWFERGRQALAKWPQDGAAKVRREVQLLLAVGDLARAKQAHERARQFDLTRQLRDQLTVQRALIHLSEGNLAAVQALAPAGPVTTREAFQLLELELVTRVRSGELARAERLVERLRSSRAGLDFHTLITFFSCRAELLQATGKDREALELLDRGLNIAREELLRAELLGKRAGIRLRLEPRRLALEDAAEAARLAPGRETHRVDLVRIALALGMRDRALAELERAESDGFDGAKLRALAEELRPR